jgi:hypothetical protein
MENFLKSFADILFNFFEKLSAQRFATPLIVSLVVCLSALMAFPSYDLALSPEMSDNWEAVFEQKEHPFTPANYQTESHIANLAFRLTPVLIARLFGIGSITSFLILQFVAFVLMIFVLYRLFQSEATDPVVVCCFMAGVAMTFFGNILCSDYRGIFDVFAFLFLACAMLFRMNLLVFVSLLLAFFTDERALIASSLVYIFVLLQTTNFSRKFRILNLFPVSTRMWTVVLAWITYFAIRFYLSYEFKLQTNAAGILDWLKSDPGIVSALPFGAWTGLEGFWILAVLCGVLLWKRSFILFAAFVFSASVVTVVSISVFDITRSMAYIFPIIFVSLRVISTETNRVTMRYIALLTMGLCFFPTYYLGGNNTISWLLPLPLQIVRFILA